MSESQPTESQEEEVPERFSGAVERALNASGVSVSGGEEWNEQTDGYEVAVAISGELLLEEVLARQGPLLYVKDGVEVSLRGFRDDRLLLRVKSDGV